VGKTIRQAFPGEPEDWLLTYDAVLRTGEPIRAERSLVSQGRVLDLYSFRVADHTQRRVAVIFKDITARKRGEEERERLLAELERVNAEFRQFAQIVSHDLTEPLRAMHTFITLLAKRYQGQLDTQADGYLAFVVEGAQRMQQMLTDLLAYTRVGGQTAAFTAVDCEAVLSQVLDALRLGITECRATITHDPLPTVCGDALRLGHVFQNLLGNALKFCHTPPRIHIAARRDGPAWVFSVQDNGIGLDPRHAEQIFAVFQRLHPRSAYPGTGMGLAICKRIVEQHGGRIWVESQPGAGSTFSFTIGETPRALSGS